MGKRRSPYQPVSRALVVLCDQHPTKSLRTGPERRRLLYYARGINRVMNKLQPGYVAFCGPDREPYCSEQETPARGMAELVEQDSVPSATFLFADGYGTVADQIEAGLRLIGDEADEIDEYAIVCDRRPWLMLKVFIAVPMMTGDACRVVSVGRPRHLPYWLRQPAHG